MRLGDMTGEEITVIEETISGSQGIPVTLKAGLSSEGTLCSRTAGLRCVREDDGRHVEDG